MAALSLLDCLLLLRLYDWLKRDWRIFLGSVVLSNAAWALVCFGGVEVFRRLWK